MTKIVLEGMTFFAYHGFYEEERQKGNEFRVDISVSVPDYESEEDRLSGTLNYEELYSICKNRMNESYKLLETIAVLIKSDIFDRFAEVSSIEIRIEKLNPPIDGPVEKAAVILIQDRHN